MTIARRVVFLSLREADFPSYILGGEGNTFSTIENINLTLQLNAGDDDAPEAIADALGRTAGEVIANAFYAMIGWEIAALIGKSIGWLAGSLLAGGVCGLPVGLALREAEHPISKGTMWRIITGWASVWAVCLVIFSVIIEYTELTTSQLSILGLVIFSMIVGALGSLNMFSLLNQDKNQQ